jgi:SRSO17 transposase
MTFPLMFKVYKPRERLKPGDDYMTEPEIASKMIHELQNNEGQRNICEATSESLSSG